MAALKNITEHSSVMSWHSLSLSAAKEQHSSPLPAPQKALQLGMNWQNLVMFSQEGAVLLDTLREGISFGRSKLKSQGHITLCAF